MNNARKQIAARLRYEFERRNLSADNVAQESNLAKGVVSAYLEGKKEIDINELKLICAPFDINSTRLLFSKDYPKVKLSFRNTSRGVQKIAAVVEDIFLILQQSITSYTGPSIARKTSGSEKKTELINEAATLSKKIQKDFPTPQDFLRTFSVPVIALNLKDCSFDAFLIRKDNKIAICINSSTPPPRIQFSLAHEISHIIFDENTEVPVDTFLPNFYWKKWITKSESPEFFAYKFAQFYLLPFEKIYSLSYKWPKIDLELAQKLVENGITTKQVLANAINDYLTVNPPMTPMQDDVCYTPSSDQFRRMDWEEGHDMQYPHRDSPPINFQSVNAVVNSIKASSKSGFVYEYLRDNASLIDSILINEKQNISEEIFEEIKRILTSGTI